MNCPVCKNILDSKFYTDTLPVGECENCGGAWIRANEYAQWLKTQAPGAYETKAASEPPVATDSKQALLCPDCGRFLRRYKVAADLDFHLDRCNHCNGIWLDRNEWQRLATADLHDELHRVFTEPWQRRIANEAVAQRLDHFYAQKFGAEDYAKIKEIRTWLLSNTNGRSLLAFLMDVDPYST
jgi:Zn-finger nucleic acid-binding protein